MKSVTSIILILVDGVPGEDYSPSVADAALFYYPPLQTGRQ